MKKIVVLLALIGLMSNSVVEAVKGTAHDLSTNNATGSDEVCVFCHTPHNGDPSAPLWNRSIVNATEYYNSGTFDATASGSGSLCLSCHDGTSVTDPLANPSNAGTPTNGVESLNASAIGTDLSNDHPVGFDMNVSAANDTEIKDTSDPGVAALTSGWIGCYTCHDVHGTAFPSFLVKSNSNSALCLTCHLK